jgi:hypothetical protein
MWLGRVLMKCSPTRNAGSEGDMTDCLTNKELIAVIVVA